MFSTDLRMIGFTFLMVALSVFSPCCGQKKWALIAAGSSGYGNYRHQADICHAYHVLIEHGFPKEHIIVMMMDDIAYNDDNPVKGNIINQPDGPNVYNGTKIDYRDNEVTPNTFLKVLSGDEEGIHKTLGRQGRVIKSGPHDRIFVVFADHGAPGVLLFPSDALQAKDLHRTIKSMHKDKKYKQMVFYIEACESGSMFSDLLESDINVYATTASNPDESSYACYYDSTRDTYLGDVYSVMWMQDSDEENLKVETLEEQFRLVKKETNTSHVMQYGDLTMGSLKVSYFQGNLTKKSNGQVLKKNPLEDAVRSEDVAMTILQKRLSRATGDETIRHQAALDALMKRKTATEEFFKNLSALTSRFDMYDIFLKAPVKFTDYTCYQEGFRLIQEMCPGMQLIQNDYALRKLRVLANMCESEIPQEKIWAAIGKISYESMIC